MSSLMQVIVPTREHRSITRRRSGRAATRTSPPPAPPEPRSSHMRERAAGGPEDVARYDCACGYVFQAAVSASVGCPHCGDAQAW